MGLRIEGMWLELQPYTFYSAPWGLASAHHHGFQPPEISKYWPLDFPRQDYRCLLLILSLHCVSLNSYRSTFHQVFCISRDWERVRDSCLSGRFLSPREMLAFSQATASSSKCVVNLKMSGPRWWKTYPFSTLSNSFFSQIQFRPQLQTYCPVQRKMNHAKYFSVRLNFTKLKQSMQATTSI